MNEIDTGGLTVLGASVREPTSRLEVFEKPASVKEVVLLATEFTSLCPVTGQPDFADIEIRYAPAAKCVESKSLKLYLWQFRERGVFCEALAAQIAADLYAAMSPERVTVKIWQRSRGGIAITAEATLP
jgi:7-cyano-7-deazaguanine reductase